MEVFPGKRIRNRALLIVASCLLLSMPFIARGRMVALFMGIIWGGGTLWFLAILSRYLRREKVAARGISPGIRNVLREKVSFYSSLSPEDRVRYEENIAVFLSEHRITGIDGVQVTDLIRTLVAATAVRLTFRRPGWEYHNFGEILIYPSAFAADGSYSTRDGVDAAGMVHSQGDVILSLPHLLRSFDSPDDGFNVGYHEFAHVLDGRHPDGVPDELSLGSYRPWSEAMQREFEKVHRHRSVLRSYAGTNPAEFFACAVEYFFEKPEKMKEKAPEVYEQLRTFFNQDPAGENRPTA